MSNSTSRPAASASITGLSRRAVGIVEHLGVFQQRVGLDQRVEFCAVDEMIIAPVLLRPAASCAWSPRSTASTPPSSSSSRRDSVVLPAPEGDDSTSISPRRATSCCRFCAIAIITPDSAPARGTARPRSSAPGRYWSAPRRWPWRYSVFDSRLSSCARKSSRRPTAPPSAMQFLRLRDVRGEAVELLADVGLGGEHDGFLMQAVGIEALRGRQQRRHLLGQPRLDRLRLAPRALSRRARQARRSRQAARDSRRPSACALRRGAWRRDRRAPCRSRR